MENKAKLFFTFMAFDHKLKWKKEPLALQLVQLYAYRNLFIQNFFNTDIYKTIQKKVDKTYKLISICIDENRPSITQIFPHPP